jgi:hypothetical protein
MKAILEYNLPDDEHEYSMALQGASFHSVLWKMDQYLRSKVKHSPEYLSEYHLWLVDSTSDDTYKAYVECREALQGFISDHNVSFD